MAHGDKLVIRFQNDPGVPLNITQLLSTLRSYFQYMSLRIGPN